MKYQVLYIKKPGGSDNIHFHITEVFIVSKPDLTDLDRSLNASAKQYLTGWKRVEDVIRELKDDVEFYCVDGTGNTACIEWYPMWTPRPGLSLYAINARMPLSISHIRKEFIRTKPDSTAFNNLLSLPNYYTN